MARVTGSAWRAGLCSSSLVSMSAQKSALEALAMMRKHDVSAVAVVNSAGRLMGSFSMSAMRSIVVEHFGALALPVAEFLALAWGEPGAYGAAAPPALHHPRRSQRC